MMTHVTVINNSLTSHFLTTLRDRDTQTAQFRNAAERLFSILLPQALADLPLFDKRIETPLTSYNGSCMTEDIVFVPVLRAGLSMQSMAQFFAPSARIGMIGLQRDEKTAIASEYYKKFPNLNHAHVVILDPMLATGGSSLHVIKSLEGKGHESIRLVSVVAAPEGIEAIHSEYPDLQIYTASIDEKLDERKYIVPGLGDFGDRYFGTE